MVKDVLFIHIPKTGGTSVRSIFNIQTIRNAQAESKTRDSGRLCFQHGQLDFLLERKLISEDYLKRAFVFSFVRNPYDRAVSHFYFSVQKKRYWVTRGMQFLDFVENEMRSRSNYRPQSLFLGDYEYDFIGKLENFDKDILKIADLLGDKNISIEHLNSSKRVKDYREVYCDEAKRIVEDFYSVDFERFGYEYEEWHENRS